MREAQIWDGDSNPIRIPLDGTGKLPVADYRTDSEPKVFPLAQRPLQRPADSIGVKRAT
jgi:hypothetical protein